MEPESLLFTNVNLVITQNASKQPKVSIEKCFKLLKLFIQLFVNKMVNGILPILQSVEKDVDCPTHRKSITLDWSEAVTDIFPNKAETSSMISTVRIKIKLIISDDQLFRCCSFLMQVRT